MTTLPSTSVDAAEYPASDSRLLTASSLEPPSSSPCDCRPNDHAVPSVLSDGVATTVRPACRAMAAAVSTMFSPTSTIAGAEKLSSCNSCSLPSQ